MKFYLKKLTAKAVIDKLKSINLDKDVFMVIKRILENLNYNKFLLDHFDLKKKQKFDLEYFTIGSGSNKETKLKIHCGLFKQKSYVFTIPAMA